MINRKHQLSKGSIGIYLSLLVGCTAINVHDAPPKDWPKLERKTVKLGFYDLQVACGGSALMLMLGAYYSACAWVNFDTMTCTTFYAGDDDDEYVILAKEHEDTHCLGYDHIGSSMFADYWASWKQANPKWALGLSSRINDRSAAK